MKRASFSGYTTEGMYCFMVVVATKYEDGVPYYAEAPSEDRAREIVIEHIRSAANDISPRVVYSCTLASVVSVIQPVCQDEWHIRED